MRRFFVSAFVIVFSLLIGGGGAVLFLHGGTSKTAPLTLVTTAVDTVTATASLTATSTPTELPTETWTASPTDTFTPSVTPTVTATLAVRLLYVTVINPGVMFQSSATEMSSLTPTATALPPTLNVPNPPDADSIPRAIFTPVTLTPVGWVRYKDTDIDVTYVGNWTGFEPTTSFGHHYTYTDDPTGAATFHFFGAGLIIHYVLSRVGGMFAVVVDGKTIDTIDSYTASPLGDFGQTPLYQLSIGWHTVQMLNTVHKDDFSGGHVIALDALDIYKDGLPSTAVTSTPSIVPSVTATASPAPTVAVQLVVAPPTVQPTVTAISPGVIDVSLTIGYDANNNKVLDPNEGAAGISVRIVRTDTNHVVASGITDSSGYVHFQVVQMAGLMIVIPYLGKSWPVSASPMQSASAATPVLGTSFSVSYTLLIPPVNQPALIP